MEFNLQTHTNFFYIYFFRSEYMTYVTEALELEDTIKNYERRSMTGWFAPLPSFRLISKVYSSTKGSMLYVISPY